MSDDYEPDVGEAYRQQMDAMWARLAAKFKRVVLCPVCRCASFRVKGLLRTKATTCPLCHDAGWIHVQPGHRDDV